MKKHSILAPSLLSLFFPGMGQIYNGQIKKGVAVYISTLALSFAFYLLAGTFQGLSLVIFSLAIVYTYAFIQALIHARKVDTSSLSKYNTWSFYMLLIIAFLIINFLSTSFVKKKFEAFKIPSASMEPTIQIADHIIVEKSKPNNWKNNDLVVFTLPNKPDVTFIKRIIATQGQEVELKGKNLLINGELQKEPFAQWSDGGRFDFKAQKVPEGMVFLLGDNRDTSRDSRFWKSPFIPTENIVGKVKYTYWNSNKPTERLGISLN